MTPNNTNYFRKVGPVVTWSEASEGWNVDWENTNGTSLSWDIDLLDGDVMIEILFKW